MQNLNKQRPSLNHKKKLLFITNVFHSFALVTKGFEELVLVACTPTSKYIQLTFLTSSFMLFALQVLLGIDIQYLQTEKVVRELLLHLHSCRHYLFFSCASFLSFCNQNQQINKKFGCLRQTERQKQREREEKRTAFDNRRIYIWDLAETVNGKVCQT